MPVTEVTTPQGRTYTNTKSTADTLGLADGDHDPNLLTLFQDMIEMADWITGTGTATSTDPVTVGLGTKSFNIAPSRTYGEGVTLKAYSAADPSVYMTGPVTATDGASVTLNVLLSNGAGSHSDWIISVPFDLGFVRRDGDIITGPLKIQNYIPALDAPAGQYMNLRISRDDIPFMDFGLDDAPLTDTAGGSLIFLHTFDNSGAWTGRPLEIDRATGEIRTMGLNVRGYALENANLRGTRASIEDLGAVGAETITITAARWDGLAAELTGNTTFDFGAQGIGFMYERKLELTQGTGGGFTPTWTLGGSGGGVKRMGSIPNYASQAAGTVTAVTAQVWNNKLRLWETEEP
tara:strand:+ start:12388 stop:13434 length:1047 start_codon:yes stop_codon:yes gene_type:complete